MHLALVMGGHEYYPKDSILRSIKLLIDAQLKTYKTNTPPIIPLPRQCIGNQATIQKIRT